MTSSGNSCVDCSSIKESLDRLRAEIPKLKTIADSFEDLFVGLASTKDMIPSISVEKSELDTIRFSQGVPILRDWKVNIPADQFLVSAQSVIPAMQACFPNIMEKLDMYLEYIKTNQDEPIELLLQDQMNSSKSFLDMSKALSLEDEITAFITTIILKPFAEKIAESLNPLPADLNWNKGYCPICGSWPEVSFIRGAEGKRSLRCSFCAFEWAFPRLMCPFCETTDQTKLELYYSDDRSFERAELCNDCKKYIVSLDTRNMISIPAPQVTALGMIYLDILAQEKGYSPGAICAWNVIDGEKPK